MHEPRLGRRRRVQAQPAQPGLDRRQGLADRVQLRLPQVARLERRIGGPAGEPVDGAGLDRVGLGERGRELTGEPLARDRELVAAQDPGRDRGAGDELHRVGGARAEAPAGRLEADRGRDRHPRQVGGLHRPELDLERVERHPRRRLAPDDPARLAAGRDEEGLARGAALDRAQLERAGIVAGRLGERLAHALRIGSLSRHRASRGARARGGRSGARGSRPGPCTSTRCTDRDRSPRADPTGRRGARSSGSAGSRS